MKQQWDMSIVNKLLLTLPYNHPDRHTLEHVLKNATPDGTLTVTARFPDGMNMGRKTETGYQRTSRQTRAKCMNNMYNDIDVVNCHLVILDHLLTMNEISHPVLQHIISNRDQIITDLQALVNCTREEAKIAIIKVMFLGKNNHGIFIQSQISFKLQSNIFFLLIYVNIYVCVIIFRYTLLPRHIAV